MKKKSLLTALLSILSPIVLYAGLLIANYQLVQIVSGLGVIITFIGASSAVLSLIPVSIMTACMVRKKQDFFDWNGHKLEWSIVTICMLYGGLSVFLCGIGIIWLGEQSL